MNTIEKALNNLNPDDKLSRDEPIFSGNETKQTLELPWDVMSNKGMLTPEKGRSQIAEEMRAIKRPLLRFSSNSAGLQNDHKNIIMVTSSVPGEGKSFSSINLAVSIAMEMDKTALLIDADVAKPSIGKYLGYNHRKGLVDYLMGDEPDLSELFLKTDLPKLTILPAGKQHHYSTELLASENMRILLDELATRYHDRIVIFDSPPVLATSEAQVLANQMGQVVVVVEAVKTTQLILKEALEKISGANIAGLVLNKSRVKAGGSYYGYGYGYGYGHKPEDE